MEVSVDVEAKTTLSYAMAHNGLRLVDRVAVRSHLAQPCTARVSVRVEDSEGLVTRPFETLVDLAPGATTQLDDLDVVLDAKAMLDVDERRPAQLVVSVEDDDGLLAEHVEAVELLAASQWLAAPRLLAMELLAAFVMPNDPAVQDLLEEAAALLLERTGSAAIDGYQGGAERVDEIARALWDAATARGIRYVMPPASWADVGQKVRTPSTVLTGSGTCLDTTIMLAAALEQSGLNPLLWLVEGHAFLGYWRDDKTLNSSVHTEVIDVVNLVDLGQIALFETTLLTGSSSTSAREAHRTAYRDRLQDISRALGVVDVKAARGNGIVPLPARRRVAGGQVQVFEYRPATHSRPPAPLVTSAPRPRPSTTPIPPRVQQWKNALLDLTLRNKLLNYTRSSGIELVVPEGRLGHLEDLVSAERPLQLLPSDELDAVQVARGVRTAGDLDQAQLLDVLDRRKALHTGVPAGSYSSRLRQMAYKAKTLVEETGANNLYLALGSLVWEYEGKELRSPLVLVPMTLSAPARGVVYRMSLDPSGGSTPNYCLLEKLRQVHGMTVPGLADPELDDSGIDLDGALHAMRTAILERGLPYRVEDTADLAILQFAKFRLWKDLDEHWPQLMHNALVRHLVESPNQAFEDQPSAVSTADLDELDAACPIPADASQLAAVAEAVAGRTFVLEGPPGTGKSQTITNLLTRVVSEGKRVLFVAEKRAALDVVRARLDAVGMSPFCLDLHDKSSKPIVVRAQIQQALDHRVDVDQQGLAADEQQLRAARRMLKRYADNVHAPNDVGASLYSARTQVLILGQELPELPVPSRLLTATGARAVPALRQALADLPEVADPARPSAKHPWGFLQTPGRDLQAVLTAAERLDTTIEDLPQDGSLDEVLAAVRRPAQLSFLAELLGADVPLDVLDRTQTGQWQSEVKALQGQVAAFVAAAHPGLDVATPAALDLPLGDLHAAALAAAQSGFFGRKKRLGAVLADLAPALRPDARVKPKQLPELTGALVQVQGAVRGLAQQAGGVAGVQVPQTWNPLTAGGRTVLEHQMDWLARAGAAVRQRDGEDQSYSSALRRYLSIGERADSATAAAVREAAQAAHDLDAAVADPDAWDLWAGRSGLLQQWTSSRGATGGAAGLRRWEAFLAAIEPLRRQGMGEAHRRLLSGAVQADEAVQAFDRGLAESCVRERLETTGLDAFDRDAHDRAVQRFVRSSRTVREHLVAALPRDVLEARPFRSGTSTGLVGGLRRELAKQRRGLGVRALLETYGDLITQVLPCVLVSPDSVARFFPVDAANFDLVVFDEASQIRVADAVGAMGRARSVVVVGDSKQMPPSAFGEGGMDDEEEEASDIAAVADQESILTECVQAGVRSRMLTWHYRSADESLITFSNRKYYKGGLASFPAPTHGAADGGVGGHGVTLRRVDGQFHRSGKGRLLRTNPVEAEAVVAEIRSRFAAETDGLPSLGVVTFNQQQRAYVEALLRDLQDERITAALDAPGEGLFVKNLENVQGDERDVVLFSTAFSVNDRGVLPLNFGPLNRAGGERRLNVAVTRARQQVVVFSSFDPEQLRAEETTAKGVKDLRAYLEMAAGRTQGLAADRATLLDRHVSAIAEELRGRDLIVTTDVGLSDFRLDLSVALPAAPDRPVMAVLCDGPKWAGRGTVGDRDGLPASVLTSLMRWPAVERVWLPAWLADSSGAVDRLVRAAREASTRPARHEVDAARMAAAPATSERQSARVEARPIARVAPKKSAAAAWIDDMGAVALPGEEPFIAWSAPPAGGRDVLDRLPDPTSARRVSTVLAAAVQAEGPVHTDRLARLVANAFGLARVSSNRSAGVLRQLDPGLLPDPSEPFAWPLTRRPKDWEGFRRATADEPRPVEHVSLRELGNAAVALCRVSAGVEEDELLRETLAVFGGRRLTPAVQQRLVAALRLALEQRRLVKSGDRYDVAGPNTDHAPDEQPTEPR